MSPRFDTVAAREHGVLRLYEIDRAEALALRDMLEAEDDAGDSAVDAEEMATDLLGAADVDADWLDLVDIRDLSAITLSGYLDQGYDVPQEQLDAFSGELARAEGWVLIVPSTAFPEAQTLDPGQHLTPLAIFETDEPPAPLRPMVGAQASEDGQALSTGAPADDTDDSSNRRVRNMVVIAALLAAGLLLALAALAQGQ